MTYQTPGTGEEYGGGPIIEQINSLLRGEISAEETYRMAVDHISEDKDAEIGTVGMLQEIQEEHSRAADTLRDRIRELGAEPSDSSSIWGAWAKFTQGTANLFGQSAALKSLKEGEEHGLKDYQDALDSVDPATADVVRQQLIPAQQRHINLLDQLIDSTNK